MRQKYLGRGRPAHVDDPPVFLATTIPTSIDQALRELSTRLGRPRSELLTESIKALARRYAIKKPRKAGTR